MFIDQDLSQDEKMEKINEWVEASIDNLLSQNEDRKLSVSKGIVSKEDFMHLLMIINNKISVELFEVRKNEANERKSKGMDDEAEYIGQILEGMEEYFSTRKRVKLEVLKQVGISNLCFETSFESHIGDESEIDQAFISKSFETIFIHSIKNSGKKSEDEAIKLFKEVIESTLSIFAKESLLGKFETIPIYLYAFDTVAVDIALSKGLTEADFRGLVLEHDTDKQE